MILMAQGCHPSGNQRRVLEGMCQSYCKGILGQSGGGGQNLARVWPEIEGVLKVPDVTGRQGISVRFCAKGKYLRKSLKWCFLYASNEIHSKYVVDKCGINFWNTLYLSKIICAKSAKYVSPC